jgi:hypothetical protein
MADDGPNGERRAGYYQLALDLAYVRATLDSFVASSNAGLASVHREVTSVSDRLDLGLEEARRAHRALGERLDPIAKDFSDRQMAILQRKLRRERLRKLRWRVTHWVVGAVGLGLAGAVTVWAQDAAAWLQKHFGGGPPS